MKQAPEQNTEVPVCWDLQLETRCAFALLDLFSKITLLCTVRWVDFLCVCVKPISETSSLSSLIFWQELECEQMSNGRGNGVCSNSKAEHQTKQQHLLFKGREDTGSSLDSAPGPFDTTGSKHKSLLGGFSQCVCQEADRLAHCRWTMFQC